MRALIVAAILAAVFAGAASPARAETSLERIRKRGRLTIGTDATYPPFEFKQGGALKGFDIDLGNEIGRELGVRTEWINLGWDGVLPGLETGKFDLVMSGVTITEERKKGGLGFSRPYFLSGQAIVRRRGDRRIQRPEDLRGKSVGVQVSTTGQTAAEGLGLSGDRIRRFDTLQDALLAVRNESADAAIGDLPALFQMLAEGYPELELAGGIFVEESIGVVARGGERELIAAVNEALGALLADGRYGAIYHRWIAKPVVTGTIIGGLDRVRDQGTLKASVVPGQGTGTGASTARHDAPGSALVPRWELLRSALPLLLRGAGVTLQLTFFTLLLGIPLGLLVALARLSGFKPLEAAATAYVEVVRGTPLLMQIYVTYFILPTLGLRLDAMTAGIAALSLNAAAYIGEIFRAGIQSIDTGQMEAARSLGMDYTGAMRWVILPQTVRRVLPPLTNEAVALLKDSSLVSVVALTELMRVGREIATTSGSPITMYLAVALLYLAMTLPLTHLVRRLEARWQPVTRPRLIGRAKAAAVPQA
jgi:His/Glu/Gln/Arg/opine family amino acid ABC transporter permease subunit